LYLNGRDFESQSWDSPEPEGGAFLTKARLSGSEMAVDKAAFGSAGQVLDVDNDADGVADGIWLADVLPAQQADSGEVALRVSYLVLDLDGRFNVNAHGSTVTLDGVGPASINGGAAFNGGGWNRVLSGTGVVCPPDSGQQRRPTPTLGYTVDGRFGKTVDRNPYLLRLDPYGSRLGVPCLDSERRSTAGVASLFTAGELERLLRPFDADASDLPPRLAAMLGNDAEKARMLVTTDSWDTLSVVGTTIPAASATSKLPQEFLEGRRVDLNKLCAAGDFDGLCALLSACQITGSAGVQWAANILEFYDDNTTPESPRIYAGMPYTGVDRADYGDYGGNNKRFGSLAQLLAVPEGDKKQVDDTTLPMSKSLLNSKLLGALFITNDLVKDKNGQQMWCRFQVNDQGRDLWREPGRVNVNTCGTEVYQAVVDGGDPKPPAPAQTVFDVLKSLPADPTASIEKYRISRTKADRLANIATVRSNVFAVWITVEMSEKDAPDQPKRYGRVFAIIDRSIPVGYSPGLNLNARDVVRLVRYLD
jgi:hypothetical protein